MSLRQHFINSPLLAFTITSIILPTAATAAPLPFFDTIPGGRTYFDSRVNGAGGTLWTDALTGLNNGDTSWARADFTITATNGYSRSVDANRLNSDFASFPGLNGLQGGDSIDMSADGQVDSGLTFTFSSAINGFGLDLENWATCCFPSGLYLSFDGGSPILVGEAAQDSDNPGDPAGHGPRNFIGAIDDSGTFTTITFYGMGNGDALYAGGVIRYALVPLGSISGGYVKNTVQTPVSGYASYLDQFDNSGSRQTVGNYLNTLPSQDAAEAIKTIFPVNGSISSQTSMGGSSQTANTLLEKVGTVLGQSASIHSMNFADSSFSSAQWIFGDKTQSARQGLAGGDPVMALASTPYKKFQGGQNALWVDGVTAGANGNKTAQTMGYDTASRGVVAGYEIAIDENHLAGVLGSSFFSDIDIDNHAGKTDAENYNFGFYGQKLLGQTKLTGLVTGGYSNYETVRNISLGGVVATPESDYDGWSLSSSVGASHLFTHDNIQLEPYLQLSYTKVWTDGYTEKNGGAFNMNVDSDDFSAASGKIGARLKTNVPVGNKILDIMISPYVGKTWELESADTTTRFVGAGTAVTVNGRDMTTHQVGFATELSVDIDENSTVKFGADLSRDNYEKRHIAFIGFGYKF